MKSTYLSTEILVVEEPVLVRAGIGRMEWVWGGSKSRVGKTCGSTEHPATLGT